VQEPRLGQPLVVVVAHQVVVGHQEQVEELYRDNRLGQPLQVVHQHQELVVGSGQVQEFRELAQAPVPE